MCGCRCWRRCWRFCGPPTWPARPLSGTSRSRQEAASSTDLIYETADGYITAAVQTNRQWEGLTPRARPAGMARRRALQDAGVARPECRGAAADDAGRADRRQIGRMARPADQGRRAVRPGADPQRGDPPSACRGARNRRAIRPSRKPGGCARRAAAARFSGTPTAIRRGAPALGEHTDEVLGEIGYSAAADRRAAGRGGGGLSGPACCGERHGAIRYRFRRLDPGAL